MSTEALQPDRDAVLYLVDASESMRNSGTLIKITDAISSSIRIIQQNGDRHFDSGVILYGCRDDHNSSNFKDVKVVMKVSDPKIKDLKQLMQLDETKIDSILSSLSLINGLQQAKLELAALKPNSFRRLVIITDKDSPGTLSNVQPMAHDLVNMNVLVVPIFLNRPDHTFDPAKFWSELVYLPPSLSMASRNSNLNISLEPYDLNNLENDLSELVLSKAERKPTVFRGVIILSELQIGVAAYKVFGRKSARRAQNVIRRNGIIEPLGSTTLYLDSVSRLPVDKSNIEPKFVTNSRESVPVSSEDVEMLHNFGKVETPKIVIDKFIPIDTIKNFQEIVTKSLLIVPSNFKLENSKSAFASLRKSMICQQVVASVLYISKSNNKPPVYGYLYAFNPFPHIFDRQMDLKPDTQKGMYFVQAPFVDDLRSKESKDNSKQDYESYDDFAESYTASNTELEQNVSKLLWKFRIETGFDPSMFPNPSEDQFSRILEAVALNQDIPHDPIFDPTVPNYEKITRNASQLCSNIQALLANCETKEVPSKKTKPLCLDEFKEAYDIGRLNTFTVPELKWALRELNLLNTGKKDELLDRLSAELAN